MQKTSKVSKNKFVSIVLITFFVFGLFSFNTFEGGSCAGVTWTYNSATNTATASGTGSTNFDALVAADTAGGWGVYTADESGTQINCEGKIVVGDGTNACVFSDTKKAVIFRTNIVVSSGDAFITIKAGSTFTMGTLIDATTHSTSDGVTFFVQPQAYWHKLITGASTANIYLYSCSFTTASSVDTIIDTRNLENRVWNVFLSKVNLGFSKSSGDFFNLMILNAPYPWYAVGTIERVYITHNVYACLRFIGDTYTVKNLYCRDIQSYFIECGYMPLTTTPVYMINVDSDLWDIKWIGSPYGIIYRQYTFNLNVLNGEITDFVENATVQLWKDSTLVYEGTTNSSGMIPTQTLTYGYYQQSTGNTIQNATSPYYLVITHPDWQTYVSRFYITEPLRLTVSMQEPTYTGYTEVEKSDYTTIIIFVISLILCIIGLALTVPLLPLIALTVSVINVLLLTEISMFNILLIILNIIFTVITIVRTKTKNN